MSFLRFDGRGESYDLLEKYNTGDDAKTLLEARLRRMLQNGRGQASLRQEFTKSQTVQLFVALSPYAGPMPPRTP